MQPPAAASRQTSAERGEASARTKQTAAAQAKTTSSELASKLRLITRLMVPAWGRAVVAILGSAVLISAFGLSEESGYAIVPGLYMAMSPPAGALAVRTITVAAATLVIAAMALFGALASVSVAAVVVCLALVAFVSALLPRLEPRAASMQLPLLMGFIYSAAHPISEAPAVARAAAVLLALPVYLVATAILFQTDPRQPLVRGAAALLDAIANSLAGIPTGVEDAGRDMRGALISFAWCSAA